MLISSLTVLAGLCSAIIAAFAVRLFITQSLKHLGAEIDLPSGISVHRIGEIERDLADLETVIVIADKVEKPTNTLSEALEHNFRRGVKYLFLVSNDLAAKEVDGYYQIFKALATIVLRRHGTTRPLTELIEIKQLPYNWDDYPIIFYRIRLSSGKYRLDRRVGRRNPQ